MEKQFEKFLNSAWGLEVWKAERIVFQSKKAGVKGLLAFIIKHGRKDKDLIIFDKIVGQGAALLSAYLKAKAVYGKLGSRLAAKTLRKYKIKFYFQETIPNILNRKKTDICPIEKLSFSKTPSKFYNSLID